MLFSCYLKEHDKEKGRYQFILRKERNALVTCLELNDRGWKDNYLFARGELVFGLDGPRDAMAH